MVQHVSGVRLKGPKLQYFLQFATLWIFIAFFSCSDILTNQPLPHLRPRICSVLIDEFSGPTRAFEASNTLGVPIYGLTGYVHGPSPEKRHTCLVGCLSYPLGSLGLALVQTGLQKIPSQPETTRFASCLWSARLGQGLGLKKQLGVGHNLRLTLSDASIAPHKLWARNDWSIGQVLANVKCVPRTFTVKSASKYMKPGGSPVLDAYLHVYIYNIYT